MLFQKFNPILISILFFTFIVSTGYSQMESGVIEADYTEEEIQEMLENYVPDSNDRYGLPHISAIKYETFLNWNSDRSDRELIDILGYETYGDLSR